MNNNENTMGTESRGRRVAKGIGLIVAGAALATGDVGCFCACEGNVGGHGLASAGLAGMYAVGMMITAGAAVEGFVRGTGKLVNRDYSLMYIFGRDDQQENLYDGE